MLNAHPEVIISAVVGRKGKDGNEEVIAFVQPAPGGSLDEKALASWAGERLAPYKRPSRIVPMETLPAAASGKVLKHQLKDLAAELD